jgi:hypothetical protein
MNRLIPSADAKEYFYPQRLNKEGILKGIGIPTPVGARNKNKAFCSS